MRSSILSGPVCGRGSMSRLGSARRSKVRDCDDEDGLARGAFGSPFSLDGVGIPSCGVVGFWYCEIPAATAVLVCTHLRKGLECMMILRLFFLGRCNPPAAFPSFPSFPSFPML